MKGMKGIKENNKPFIDQVVDFYISTVDEAHPQGNMSAVADQFGITRAKVNKILITAGVIDSPLHRDIMELKEQGYETDDIAAVLGVSAATVRINIPYEKVDQVSSIFEFVLKLRFLEGCGEFRLLNQLSRLKPFKSCIGFYLKPYLAA